MTPRVFLRAIRIHQWVKNLLLFVPIVMAHRHTEPARLWQVALGFVAFGLCASSVYLMNDLIDVEADRHHPKKRSRPIASGAMSVSSAGMIAAALLLCGAYIAWGVSQQFLVILCGYFVTTLLYSLLLKQLVLVDIITLATLYAIRVLAGGVAASVPVSQWLLVFSLFFFVSLACVKRFSELLAIQKREQTLALGRGYSVHDIEQIAQFGSAAGYISVLVLALYITSAELAVLYTRPMLLWALFPLMLYWVSRLWLLAHRGEVDEDPIVFALSDRVSYLVGALLVLSITVAV